MMLNSIVISLMQAFKQALVYIPLMIGGYVSISLMKLPDIALESAFSFGAVLAYLALVFMGNISQPFALIITLGIAITGGVVVGFLVTSFSVKLRIPHLLSSILTVGIFQGLSLLLMGSANKSLYGISNKLELRCFGITSTEICTMFFVILLVTLIITVIFSRQLGYCFSIYGTNKKFFDYHKIDGTFIYKIGVMIAHGLAGVSGYFFAQSNNFVDSGSGHGIVLLMITALIIGKVFFKQKKLNVLLPIIGILLYLFIQQFLLKLGFDLKFFSLVQAVVVVLLVALHFRTVESSSVDQLGV